MAQSEPILLLQINIEGTFVNDGKDFSVDISAKKISPNSFLGKSGKGLDSVLSRIYEFAETELNKFSDQ